MLGLSGVNGKDDGEIHLLRASNGRTERVDLSGYL